MKGLRGIRKDRYGFRAYVKVGNIQREKRFPPDTPLKRMKDWRDEARVSLRSLLPATAPSGSFAKAVEAYLPKVAAMPTYEQRKKHLELWEKALGRNAPRTAITAGDIRAVLQQWRQEHSAATCNKRRTALMHLWSVLDGKGASNPVRDVPRFRADDALPRGRDPHTIDAALLKARRCRMRACCRVLLWTGMRPIELDRAQPDDIDLVKKTAIVRTAKGGRVRIIPLTSQAVSAWKEFEQAECWQHVPKAAPMNRWLKAVTEMAELRVYDLRHSYGTALALRDTRLDVIGSLMGHSTLELTRRYTLAAVNPDALRAVGKLALKRR